STPNRIHFSTGATRCKNPVTPDSRDEREELLLILLPFSISLRPLLASWGAFPDPPPCLSPLSDCFPLSSAFSPCPFSWPDLSCPEPPCPDFFSPWPPCPSLPSPPPLPLPSALPLSAFPLPSLPACPPSPLPLRSAAPGWPFPSPGESPRKAI